MKTVQAYLKQFGVSVMEFVSRFFRHNIFRRTEFTIIAILFFLCSLYLLTIVIATHYLQLEVASTVVRNISHSLTLENLTPVAQSDQLLNDIKEVRDHYLLIIGGISLIATLIFGYIATRIALMPTKRALSAQKHFIGNIAHELRTSISILHANEELELLETKNPNHIHLIKDNIDELNRVSGVINNLLTLNTLTTSEDVEFEPIELYDVVQFSIAKYEPLAEQKNIVIHGPENNGTLVFGNRSALEQITMNILKNAINYTETGGTIHISITKYLDSFVRLTVRDSGIGIKREDMPYIFDPFFRIDKSRTRPFDNTSGSGLGLTIVKELVKLHHGRIIVNSEPKQGTTIQIEFPEYKNGEVIGEETLFEEMVVDFTQ